MRGIDESSLEMASVIDIVYFVINRRSDESSTCEDASDEIPLSP